MQERSFRPIQSVQRAIDILECFDSPETKLSLGQLSSKVKLNKSTVHGILATLVYNGYAQQDRETSKYRLGPRLLEKSLQMLGSISIYETVHPHLVEITEHYQHTSHLFLYINQILFCADKVEAAPFAVFSSSIGCQLPIHATASGKIVLANVQRDALKKLLNQIQFIRYTPNTICCRDTLLASLCEVRAQGYAIEDEEIEIQTYSIAVPIWNYQGFLGTISVSGMKNKMTPMRDDIVKDLKQVAVMVSRQLGYTGDKSSRDGS